MIHKPILKLLFRLWLYWTGIRFHETNVVPTNSEVLRTEFKTIKDQKITFYFFRETHEDIVYRKGKFIKSETHSFILMADFDHVLSHRLVRFTNSRYFFRHPMFPIFSDQFVADVLLNLYLEFLNDEIFVIK